MSYEILLYPRQPGQDWDEVLAADERHGAAPGHRPRLQYLVTARR